MMAGESFKQRHGFAPPPVRPLHGPRHEVLRGAVGYPEALFLLKDPPPVLYAVGELDILENALSIIGARKATPYGKACAQKFAKRAAKAGLTVVSGGALGCDSAACRGALAVGGKTAVVLGGGCDVVYPQRNFGLFQQVVDAGGVVLSERAWEFPPLPYSFRARNRIIAALSRATLIVEAGLPSGTFSTADDALAAGREVWAVPGSICSPTSLGANRLISQGAMPIVDDEQFDAALGMTYGILRVQDFRQKALSPDGSSDDERVAKGDGDAADRAGSLPQGGAVPRKEEGEAGAEGEKPLPDVSSDELLAALYANPMRIDELMGERSLGPRRAGSRASEDADKLTWLMVCLAQLERDGLIARFPDGRYGPCRV